MSWLTRLYPRTWRQRYGQEFDALMEDARPGWTGTLDVLWSATKMHFEHVNWRLAGAFAMAGLLVAGILTYLTPDRFTSTAELRLRGTSGSDAEALMAEAQRLRSQTLSRQSLATLMQQPLLDLYAKERRRQPVEDVIRTMKSRDLSLEIAPGPIPMLRVSYTGADAWRTQRAVQSLLISLIDEHIRHFRSLALNSALEVVRPAKPAERAPRPGLWRSEFAGLTLGLLACLAFSTVRRFPRATLVALAVAATAAPLSLMVPQPYLCTALLQLDSPQTRQSLLATPIPEGRVEPGPAPRELLVRTTSTDRMEGQKAAQRAVSLLADTVRDRRNAAHATTPWLEVIDPPNLPTTPVTHLLPLPIWFALAGLLLGTAAGFLLKLDSKRNKTAPQAYKPA